MYLKKICKLTLDGLIHGIVIVALVDLSFANIVKNLPVNVVYLSVIVIALVSMISFWLFKAENKLSLLFLEIGSVIVTAIVVFLMYLFRIHFGFSFFSLRHIEDAAGIALIFIFLLYSFFSVIFRSTVFLVIAVLRTRKTGDGSVS